jgi:hypothetical protein
MAKFLIHNYVPSDGSEFISLQLDDHWFRMKPNEPFEMSTDSNGRLLDAPDFYAHMLIVTYGHIYGIVEVEQEKTRTGILLKVDKALEIATAELLANRHRHINQWANDQLTSRVRNNLPVLPPSGFTEESIKVLNIDLKAKYNFKPIGWDWEPDATRPVDSSVSEISAPLDVTALRAENDDLKSRMADLEAMVGKMLNQSTVAAPAAPAEPEPEPIQTSTVRTRR